MPIFSTIPKKTLLLVVFLMIIVVFLLSIFLLQGRQTSTSKNNFPQPTSSSTYITPNPQGIPTLRTAPNYTSQSAYKIVFDVPKGFSLPQTIEKVEVRRNIDNSYLSFLRDSFSLQGDPQINGQLYFWYITAQKKSLQINTATGFIQYNSDDTPLVQVEIGQIQAVKVAEDFLTKLNIVNITPNTETVIMFGGDGELSETQNEALAKFYEISYIQSYKGTPVYYHFASPARISVFIDKYGNVRSLKYFNIQPIRTLGTADIDLEEVKQRVEKGDYTVVNIEGDPSTVPSNGTITISTATAIHFDDKNNPTLFPTILLEGTLQPTNRKVSLYSSVP